MLTAVDILWQYTNVFRPGRGPPPPPPHLCILNEFLNGLRGVINIADDICVYGCGDTKEDADIDHHRNLAQLLEKCAEHNLWLSAKKLQFKSPSVTFMGHKLTPKGVEPDPAKVAAIREMPVPADKSAVQTHCLVQPPVFMMTQLRQSCKSAKCFV